MLKRPRVDVVICTHNRKQELLLTLETVFSQEGCQAHVFLYDDASSDGTADAVRAKWPAVTYLRSDQTRGPLHGRNWAIDQGHSPFVFFLDDDSHFLRRDAVLRTLDAFDFDPQVGVMTFSVVFRDGRPIAPWLGPARYVGDFYLCAAAFRRDVLEQVGQFRPWFEVYDEEWDYALRTLDRGFRIWFEPAVRVCHLVSQSGRSRGLFLKRHLRNGLYTIMLNEPWAHAVPHALLHTATVTRQLIAEDQVGLVFAGIREFGLELPRVLAERKPVDSITMWTYDELKERPTSDWRELSKRRRSAWQFLRDRLAAAGRRLRESHSRRA